MSNLLNETEQSELIPILARIWHEDDVWNVSAFDLPVVAYASTVEEARSNFEEAAEAHFKALEDFGMLVETVTALREAAAEGGFWEKRVTPREMVQRFNLPAMTIREICAVGV